MPLRRIIPAFRALHVPDLTFCRSRALTKYWSARHSPASVITGKWDPRFSASPPSPTCKGAALRLQFPRLLSRPFPQNTLLPFRLGRWLPITATMLSQASWAEKSPITFYRGICHSKIHQSDPDFHLVNPGQRAWCIWNESIYLSIYSPRISMLVQNCWSSGMA